MSSPFGSSFASSVSSPENCFAASVDDRCDTLPETPQLQTLQGNKFMTVDEAFQTIISTPTESTSTTIPRGPKDNVYLPPKKTSDNIHEYPDDCGAWGRAGTAVNSTFINHVGN